MGSPEAAHAENAYVTTDAYQTHKVYYGGYYTTYFWIDGHVAYCAQPRYSTPWSGVYKKNYVRNDAIAAVLYYGYGGPGWNYAYSHGWWPSRNRNGDVMSNDDYYAATHVLLAYLNGGWGEALYGTNQSYKNWASNNLFGWVLTNLRNNIYQVPEAFKNSIYWMDPGWNTRSGRQGQDFYSFNWVDAGGIRINKTDDSTGKALSGIRFDIYNSDQWGNQYGRAASITTDANGNAATRINELPVGWYVLKEANPPANCQAVTSYPFQVQSNFSYNVRKAVNGSYSGGTFNLALFTNRATTQIEFKKQYGGTVAPSTQIELYRNGMPTGQVRTINKQGTYDIYTWGFYNLDKYDSNGRDYVYSVKEVGVSNNQVTLDGKKYQVVQSGNTITNIELKDMTVRKVWDDKDNKYGLRPSEVKVTLKRNGASGEVNVASAVLSEGNEWTATWNDLPASDSSLFPYNYRVEEEQGTVASKIYTSTYNASEGTLTNKLATTSIKVNKSWNTQDNPKPSEITLRLMNGEQEVDSATVVPNGDDWSYTFEGVPRYDSSGNEISYSLKEDAVSGYVNIVNETQDDYGNLVFDLVNVSTEIIDIPVEKRWVAYVAEPSRPSSIKSVLYADGMPTGRSLDITSANGWKGSFTGVPRYSTVDGSEIAYTVREVPVDQYAWEVSGSQADGYVITNNFGTTSVPVKKVWTGEGSNTSRRPQSVTIRLIADGQDTGKTLSLSSSNSWAGTFSNIPKYNEQGNDIVYTVSEDAVGFYATSIAGNQTNGYTVTNKYAENETSVGVAKSWNDKDNEAGLRPDSVQVVLKKQTHNGAQKLGLTTNPNTVYKKQNITLSNNQMIYLGWWNPTLGSAMNNQIACSLTNISNNALVGYDSTFAWSTVRTNNAGIATLDMSRYNSFNLPNMNYDASTTTVLVTEANEWGYPTYMGLPSRRNEMVFVNNDYKEAIVSFPAGISNYNGMPYIASYMVDFENNNQPKPSYELPYGFYLYNNIAYPIYLREAEYNQYAGKMTIKNPPVLQTWSDPTTLNIVDSITNSTWYTSPSNYTWGRNNNSGSIYLNVPVGGSSFYPTATANARHALSFYYTAAADTTVNIKMQTQTGYWNEGSLFATFTAKKGTHYYTITQNATNALSGKVRLDFLDGSANNLNANVADLSMWNTASGTTTADAGKTATLSASNNWSVSFEGLPRFDAATNAPIEYFVEESPVENYTPSVKNTSVSHPSYTVNEQKANPYYSYSITNTLGELRDIPVSKIWDDSDDLLKRRPSSITVKLLANGTDTGQHLELNAKNNWSATFENLPSKASNGSVIAYTVSEDRVPCYAAPVVTGTQDDGYAVTNTMPLTEVSVSKEWLDLDNAYGTRPGTVTARLYANGTDTGKQLTLSENSGWSGTFTNLAVYDESGNAIAYTVGEDAVDKYTGSQEGSAATGIVLTNTLDKMSVAASKKWDSVDGQAPVASLELRLMRNGEQVSSKTVDEGTNWSCTFDGLDVYDESGNMYAYTVDEGDFEGSDRYEKKITGSAVSGFVVTNTERLSIPVYKAWEDYNDADGLRPYSVVVRLMENGTDAGKFLELSQENDWKGSFDDLPRYDADGKKISYSVSEDVVASYTTDIQGSAEGGFTVTNSHSIQFTSRTVSKVWDDGDDQDGIRPDVVTIRLKQNGIEYRTCELSDANGWMYTFEKLPITDDSGVSYEYTVEEDTVEGYEASYAQDVSLDYTVTNRHSPDTRTVTVEKQWALNSQYADVIPSSITVKLMQNGTEIQSAEIAPDASGRWTHEFTGLPIKDSDGNDYQYSVKEAPIPNFSSIVGGDMEHGFVIINHYMLGSREINGHKFWVGDNPENRPDHITVQLLRNGSAIQSVEVRPNAQGQWNFSFDEVPDYDAATGEEYTYEVRELAIDGYDPEYGYTDDGDLKIVNRATKSIPVHKQWNDDNNANGSRPTSIKVDLVAKRFTNSNALVYDDGKSMDAEGNETVDENRRGYRYSLDPSSTLVGEIKLDGSVRTAVVSARSADKSETYFSKTVDVNGSTEPVSFDIGEITDRGAVLEVTDETGTDIHASVVSLLLHDSQYSTHVTDTMNLTAANGWQGTFINVQERDNKGFLLSYEVQEEPCYGYTGEVSGNETNGYVLTNTEVKSLAVSKTWLASGTRSALPDSIEVKLLCDGEDTGRRLTLHASEGWEGSFDGLAWRDSSGHEHEYTVEEVPVDGWIPSVQNKVRSSYSAAIVNIPTIDIPVEKAWVGDEEHLSARPDQIEASLTEKVEESAKMSGELLLWESGLSSLLNSFANTYEMPKSTTYWFDNTSDTDAFVKVSLSQQNSTVSTQVIAIPAGKSTNGELDLSALSPSLPVSVKMSGTNDADRTADELADQGRVFGEATVSFEGVVDTASLSEAGEWKHVFENLPTIDSRGNAVSYSVSESSKVEGYTSSVSQDGDSYVITNTFGKMDVPVTKSWVDMDDKDGIRPEKVNVKLLANGQDTGKAIELSASSGWKGSFDMLDPSDDEGNAIEYTVEETDVPEGYEAVVRGNAVEGFEVVNVHDVKTEVSVTKMWDDTGNVKKIRPETLLVHLYANGEEIASARLSGETDTWSYTFTELPYANEDGTVIEYSVSEDDVEGYTQQSIQQTDDGYVIVNWTPAPLVELPFSGNPGIWVGVGIGIVLCLVVLSPYVRENIAVARRKRKSGEQPQQ